LPPTIAKFWYLDSTGRNLMFHPYYPKNILILLLCLSVFISNCSKPELSAKKRSQFLMGTLVEISVFGKDEDRSQLAIQNAFNEIQRIEGLMSTHISTSEISKINQSAGIKPTPTTTEVFEVISRALYWAEKTQGALDISLEPIQELWDFYGDHPSLPDEKILKQMLQKVDHKKIKLENQTVFLMEKEMGINLGAIAKGYAVDRAIKILKNSNIQHALINAGGDLKAIGSRPDKTEWKIGLQHPRIPESILASFSLSEKSVATSGDYQKYFDHEGTRYHHILNPKTGYPATNAMSATVVTNTVMDADALSTALFVMGATKGLAFINSLRDTEGLIMRHDSPPQLSQGMKSLSGFSINHIN
jgi:thiamine biosynthesis lipoprotein